jgi:rubrerythrin
VLPSNLSPLEIFDLAIRNEELTHETYDRLSRRVDLASLQAKLALLKRDEKDHRKTLKAHRQDLFGKRPLGTGADEAREVFGTVDVDAVRDKETLLRALAQAVKAEEYGAYYYERMKDRIPAPEARIFFEVLASEGRFHVQILEDQIARLKTARIDVDARGRPVEALEPPLAPPGGGVGTARGRLGKRSRRRS